MFVELSDTPSDFGSAVSINIRASHREAGAGNDTCTAYYQVFRSDETTAITGETAGTLLPQQAAFQINGYSVTDSGENKTIWDGARLRIRNDYIKNAGGDDAPCRVTAVEVNIIYSEAAGSSPRRIIFFD
jgi:hypothetical protein